MACLPVKRQRYLRITPQPVASGHDCVSDDAGAIQCVSAATAATPSSQAKISITIRLAAKTANAIWSGKNMKETSQSNPPTGAGEPSASVCVFCPALLVEGETYCCTSCEINLMRDPNYRMCGGNDD
ncbi:hypothetical protein EKL29_08115 [Pantoea sp. YU22]|nr:hypothetical protein EKL29_08115 [Pantoea sp. YU22]